MRSFVLTGELTLRDGTVLAPIKAVMTRCYVDDEEAEGGFTNEPWWGCVQLSDEALADASSRPVSLDRFGDPMQGIDGLRAGDVIRVGGGSHPPRLPELKLGIVHESAGLYLVEEAE